MRTGKYYYPDGTEITKREEFIGFYSKVYYYLNRDKSLEDRIEEILKSDTLSGKDIIDILRWKIGATTYNYQEQTVQNQWTTICASNLIKKIEGKKELSCTPPEMIKDLITFRGIGPVYAITILYFVTKGQYPIYDKFAHIALKVIDESFEYGSVITDQELRKEFNSGVNDIDKLYSCYSKYYINRLTSIFGGEYITNRDIDRALWAYGHLFNSTKSNNKK